ATLKQVRYGTSLHGLREDPSRVQEWRQHRADAARAALLIRARLRPACRRPGGRSAGASYVYRPRRDAERHDGHPRRGPSSTIRAATRVTTAEERYRRR